MFFAKLIILLSYRWIIEWWNGYEIWRWLEREWEWELEWEREWEWEGLEYIYIYVCVGKYNNNTAMNKVVSYKSFNCLVL